MDNKDDFKVSPEILNDPENFIKHKELDLDVKDSTIEIDFNKIETEKDVNLILKLIADNILGREKEHPRIIISNKSSYYKDLKHLNK